jgi:ABC-type multidrug transport system permease subunit
MLKKFLILTGASAVGMAGSQFLHNLVFGLFIQLFGADFWDRIGIGDEPVFFMLAVFVCPLAYLVGAVGSIVLMVRRRSSSNKYS